MKDGIGEFIYTDIPFEEQQLIRSQRVLDVGIIFVLINAGTWASWGIVTKSITLAGFEALFLVASALLLFLRKRVPYELVAHATFWLVYTMVTSSVVCFEGTRIGDNPVDHMWLLMLAVGTWFVLRKPNLFCSNVYVLLCFASFLLFEFSVISFAAVWPQPAENHAFAQSVSKVLQFAGVLAICWVFVREISEAEKQLSLANQRLEELLANMLPAKISQRLRKEGKSFADGFSGASVVFADLVGFTTLSAQMEPMDLVKLLNELFSKFDTFTEQLGLEKIKTIGDAYMAAAGIPEEREDHAIAAVELALRIRAELTHYSNLSVRVGINSGEVVAGVIGKKRFIYDMWGDTVNIASRMESHGLVDEIQVSESTYEQIKDQFDCEDRGEIELKGRGMMRVYLVRGRRTGSSPDF